MKEKVKDFAKKPMNQIVILLILILLTQMPIDTLIPEQYEYKIVSISAWGATSREGDDAFRMTSVTPSSSELNELGEEGWKLVDTYLEMETAFPNFGRDEYVTGIKSNVRPQRLVMIFKKKK